ncbi:MAG: carboxyl transferase domain-containing protein, partial [Oscillospiraceae bacterium]|nr:carboxyl transferase domain-containing protein [Oscillospiraceae bacterium]
MAQKKAGEILAKFFDDGAYTSLYAEASGAVVAAFGSTNGCPVYALAQSGAALSKKDTAKAVKVLEMAAKTGNPVVTLYDSIGSDLTEGLAALTGASEV